MTRMSLAKISVSVVVFALGLGAGCKGETVIKADPQTQADLDAANATLAEKNKLLASLQDQVAKCQGPAQPSPNDIVVAIEGTVLTVKPAVGGTGTFRPVSDEAAGESAGKFTDLVAKSRGAIQKCYEQALKKDTSLQARTVTLNVSSTFNAEGAHTGSSFTPSLGSAFDECIRAIAAKWSLTKNLPVKNFKAQVSLVPS